MRRYLSGRSTWFGVLPVVVMLGVVLLYAVPRLPEAHAEPGRRLCQYVTDVPTYAMVGSRTKPGVVNKVPATLFVAVDYKKKGACPEMEDPYRIAGDSDRLARLSYRQPVPKVTCEDWGRVIGATRRYDGTLSADDPTLRLATGKNPFFVDVCSQLDVDTVYEFYVISGDHFFLDGSSFRQGEFLTNRGANVRG